MERACRNGNINVVTLLLAQQSLSNRSTDCQLTLAEVSLILRHNGVGHLLAIVVVHQGHLAEDLHLALIDLGFIDHARVVQRSFELGDSHLQHTLCLTCCIVLGILRQVTLVTSLGNRCRNGRTLNRTHMIKLFLELLVALFGQVNNLVCHLIRFNKT